MVKKGKEPSSDSDSRRNGPGRRSGYDRRWAGERRTWNRRACDRPGFQGFDPSAWLWDGVERRKEDRRKNDKRRDGEARRDAVDRRRLLPELEEKLQGNKGG
jgi:hypothetical protein